MQLLPSNAWGLSLFCLTIGDTIVSNHLSISIMPTHIGLNTTARVHTTLDIIQYHCALCDYGVIPTAKELSAMMEMV